MISHLPNLFVQLRLSQATNFCDSIKIAMDSLFIATHSQPRLGFSSQHVGGFTILTQTLPTLGDVPGNAAESLGDDTVNTSE